MKNLNEYKEHEIKVLDVNVNELTKKLEEIGAKKYMTMLEQLLHLILKISIF